MKSTTQKIVREVLSLPTAPYHEDAVSAHVRAFASQRGMPVKTDRYGNLIFRGPRTFNETMAGAARITVAEVDEVVPLGDLKPDQIHTAGVYVQRVVVRPATPVTSWETPQ